MVVSQRPVASGHRAVCEIEAHNARLNEAHAGLEQRRTRPRYPLVSALAEHHPRFSRTDVKVRGLVDDNDFMFSRDESPQRIGGSNAADSAAQNQRSCRSHSEFLDV